MTSRYAIIAHDISPKIGSEAGNAWRFVHELENSNIKCDVYCARTNQLGTNNYEDQIKSCGFEFKNIKFIYVDQVKISKLIIPLILKISNNNQIGSRITYSMLYKLWLKSVEKKLLSIDYKVIHLFNHISFRWPLTKLKKNTDYIWGPVSGAGLVKLNYLKNFSFFIKSKYLIRNILLSLIIKYGSWKKFATKCKVIFAVTLEDKTIFSQIGSNVETQLDVFTLKRQESIRNYEPGESLKIMMVGRIDELKGIDIAIDSIANVDGVSLDIYGNGSLIEKYKKLLVDRQVNNIKFRGLILRSMILDEYYNYHILLHPSLKEAGSSTVLEALETGLPVIAHDAFGMAVSVDSSSGWLIRYNNYNCSVSSIKEIISTIKNDSNIISRKSKCAFVRAEKYSMQKFIDRIKNIIL